MVCCVVLHSSQFVASTVGASIFVWPQREYAFDALPFLPSPQLLRNDLYSTREWIPYRSVGIVEHDLSRCVRSGLELLHIGFEGCSSSGENVVVVKQGLAVRYHIEHSLPARSDRTFNKMQAD